jgi:hypothetical protein
MQIAYNPYNEIILNIGYTSIPFIPDTTFTMQLKYGFCNCGNTTIIHHLPPEIMDIIYNYTQNQSSHLKCPQCDFINKNNITGLIKKSNINFEYGEEDDPEVIKKYLVNNNIITVYESHQWPQLKHDYSVLNVTQSPNDNTTLIHLNIINITHHNKPVLFEISHTQNIMAFLCQISLFTMIIAEDPYEKEEDEVENVDDDFVAGDWYEDDDDEDYFDY